VRELPKGHGQGTDVVMVTMADDDGIDGVLAQLAEQGQAGETFALGVDACIQQEAVAFEFHVPRARADVGVRIQVRDLHRWG